MPDFAQRLQIVFLQLIPFLMAIVFHEVAHAFVAKKHGDNTAEKLGRLTLNPVPHIDPIGTLLFPLINMLTGIPILFGWARPVPINYNKLKPYRRGLFLVALAGPASNILLAFISAFFLVIFTLYIPSDFYLSEPLRGMAFIAIRINLWLAFFNLIPLPPLDGSRMVEAFLSYENTRKFEAFQAYSFFILLGLLFSGVLNLFEIPINTVSNWSVAIWATIFSSIGGAHF